LTNQTSLLPSRFDTYSSRRPSGDHAGFVSAAVSRTTCVALALAPSATGCAKMSNLPLRDDEKASSAPSGDSAASWSAEPACVSRADDAPDGSTAWTSGLPSREE